MVLLTVCRSLLAELLDTSVLSTRLSILTTLVMNGNLKCRALAQHGAAHLSEGGDDAGVARGNGRDAGEQQKHGENDCEQDGDVIDFELFLSLICFPFFK